MAGYSGKSLVDKLGYKLGDSVFVFGTPQNFAEYLSEEGMFPAPLPATWAHGFFRAQVEIRIFLDSVDLKKIEKGLWVSWPKKASGVETDITEQTFRDMILPLGWVDTKVAAIDETWSGLKFLRRKQ